MKKFLDASTSGICSNLSSTVFTCTQMYLSTFLRFLNLSSNGMFDIDLVKWYQNEEYWEAKQSAKLPFKEQ